MNKGPRLKNVILIVYDEIKILTQVLYKVQIIQISVATMLLYENYREFSILQT